MNERNGSLRKAAILIDSLDQQSADALLEQMGPELAARARRAVKELSGVDRAERDRVIEEFMRVSPMVPAPHAAGIELDGSLAQKLAGPRAARQPAAEPKPAGSEAPPFRFLHEAAGDTLTQLLQREHPQTIAVVAVRLPPQRAADVLTRMPAALQTEVLRRIAELDETDPEIIREVEQQIESILSDQLRTVRKRSAGLAAASAILHAVDSIERKEMLKNLGRYDDRLVSLLTQPPAADANTGAAVGLPSADDNQAPAAAAERSRAKHAKGRSGRDGQAAETGVGTDSRLVVPRRRSAIAAQREQQAAAAPTAPPTTPLEEELTFRDLAHLDDASLAEVLRSAQPQTVLLALAGAGNELVNRIQNRLPSAEAKQWRRKMEQIGPLRLRDVEHAQQQIARLVGRMAAQGAIRRPATHRLAKAA